MEAPGGHVHVSEREIEHVWTDGQKDDRRWEDCAYCSAVEWVRAIGHPEVPATHAEAEALRRDAGQGPAGATSIDQLRTGLKTRYAIDTPAIKTWAALSAALVPGSAAVVIGSMGVLDAHWRRWDPAFGGVHATCVFRLDDSPAVWWCDPLAPSGGYAGERMTLDVLETYVRAAGAGHLVGLMEAPMLPITDSVPALCDLPEGAQIYDLGGRPLTHVVHATTQTSPYAAGDYRVVVVTSRGLRQLALIGTADAHPRPVPETPVAVNA